jgi:hypothetical protein
MLVVAVVGHPFVLLWVPLVFIALRLTWWRRRSWVGPRHGSGDWL